MARPSKSQPSTQELLERGRLTLQAIEYHERAARYKAAAARLKAAMVQAENGDVENLSKWLERESDPFDSGMAFCHQEENVDHSLTHAATIGTNDGSICHDLASIESPWARMERAANARNAKARSVKPVESISTIGTVDETEYYRTFAPEDAFLNAISDSNASKERNTSKLWWKAPHVLVSLLVHVVLIVCFGLFAISAVKDHRLLSIVAASVEAENVLLESPMELISDLEVIAEPLQSPPTPFLSQLETDASLPNSFIENGLSDSSSIASLASNPVQASMVGSKILAGAEFFGIKATGNTFVYIVDSSPSMRRDGAFDAARKEIVRSLNSMKPKQRYFISFFGKEIDPMVLEHGAVERFPINAKPENLAKTLDWLSRVEVQKEGLPPNNALTEAIGMQPDGIFLLFDGDTKSDVAKFLRRVNRSDDILTAGIPKVPIHVIHFFQDSFQKQMRQIAQENGGTYRFVPRPERPSKGNR